MSYRSRDALRRLQWGWFHRKSAPINLNPLLFRPIWGLLILMSPPELEGSKLAPPATKFLLACFPTTAVFGFGVEVFWFSVDSSTHPNQGVIDCLRFMGPILFHWFSKRPHTPFSKIDDVGVSVRTGVFFFHPAPSTNFHTIVGAVIFTRSLLVPWNIFVRSCRALRKIRLCVSMSFACKGETSTMMMEMLFIIPDWKLSQHSTSPMASNSCRPLLCHMDLSNFYNVKIKLIYLKRQDTARQINNQALWQKLPSDEVFIY